MLLHGRIGLQKRRAISRMRKAFTVIALRTMVTTTALLVSILLPSLNKANE